MTQPACSARSSCASSAHLRLDTDGRCSVVLGDWHYIRYDDGGEELYDLSADPHEWSTLAADETQQDRNQALARSIPGQRAVVITTDPIRWADVLDGTTDLYRPKGK